MHPTILASFFEASPTVVATCSAGIALFLIGILATKSEIASARGLDKIVALSNLCFAIPLAVFGAEHLFGPRSLINLVPRYMPGRLFWIYFVGCALIAASLSIATRIEVRWSGLLFGIMMFLFVAMIHLRGALANPHNRIIWTIVFREMSFGGAGWILAGSAMDRWRPQGKSPLITAGRIFIAIAAIFFGVEHFLHPTGLPGVPLEKQMPPWIPGRVLIDYVTGAALLVAGVCFLLAQDADGGNLSGHLDFAAGPRHLWARLDPGAVRTGYRSQGGGDQLLCRHAAVCRSHSLAGQRDAAFRLKCRRANISKVAQTCSAALAPLLIPQLAVQRLALHGKIITIGSSRADVPSRMRT